MIANPHQKNFDAVAKRADDRRNDPDDQDGGDMGDLLYAHLLQVEAGSAYYLYPLDHHYHRHHYHRHHHLPPHHHHHEHHHHYNIIIITTFILLSSSSSSPSSS